MAGGLGLGKNRKREMNGRLHLRARRRVDRPVYFLEAVEDLRHQFVQNAGIKIQFADTPVQGLTSD